MESLDLIKYLNIAPEKPISNMDFHLSKEDITPENPFPEFDKIKVQNTPPLTLYNQEELEHSPLAATSYILTEEGWTPSDIGTWNPFTRIATLVKEINESIEIQTDSVSLTGAGCCDCIYTIDGSINKISSAILINGRENITISNIKIINSPTGIAVYNSDNITIKENIFINNTSAGIFFNIVRNSIISTNEFMDSNKGIFINADSSCLVIDKNLITNSSYGIHLNSNVTLSKITNNTILKSNNASNFSGIYNSYYCNFNSIENNKILIQNSNISDRAIYIVGIHTEYCNFLTVSNNKVLIENNQFSITNNDLSLSIYGLQFTSAGNGNAICKYNHVSIKNNNFYCKDHYLYTNIYLIHLTPSDAGLYTCEYNKLYFNNNTINYTATAKVNFQSYIYGIYIGYDSDGNFINNNIIKFSNSSISSNNADTICRLYGIYLASVNAGILMDKNSITLCDNTLPEPSSIYAFYLSSSNNGNMLSNNIGVLSGNSATSVFGIYFYSNNSGNKIQDNIFSNNQGTAIYFSNSNTSNLITGNELCNNSGIGMYFNTSNLANIIQNNCINNNLQSGMHLNYNNDGNNIIKNEFNNNKNNGIYFDTSNDQNRILNNSISNNTMDGISFKSNNNINRVEYNNVCFNGNVNINVPSSNLNNIIKHNCIDKA